MATRRRVAANNDETGQGVFDRAGSGLWVIFAQKGCGHGHQPRYQEIYWTRIFAH